MTRPKQNRALPPIAVIANLLLVYAAYSLTRLAFYLENKPFYEHLDTWAGAWTIFQGGIYFDTSAIAYTNALYLLLVLLPLHRKETAGWQLSCKWLFLISNGLSLAMNLGDTVYFQYTGRRTTTAFFDEFSGDEKLGSIIGIEFLNHWYLVLFFIVLMALLYWCYIIPYPDTKPRRRYYITQTASLLTACLLCWGGMRGGFWDNRPIKISTANQFIVRPNDASLILNTPFSMIRTIGKASYPVLSYYDTKELESIYTPIHLPDSTPVVSERKNVVVIFLESFGREYIGSLNKDILPGYRGYTPFLDSLMNHATSFRYTFANGRASIDAMPSALSGLPMLIESFVAGSHSINQLDGLAACLGRMGYESAFFHGAPATSLGFQGFTKSTGFQQCWSEEDFMADPRTPGEAGSDHWWGIWDEPFLQYFRMKMNEMHEPFLTTLFTLTSHHPFHVPEEYQEVFTEEEMPIHKCIRYTDYTLKRFFQEASKEPWFNNTIFVMTGDHTNMSNHAEYRSGLGLFSTSIIFYDPTGKIEPGIHEGIAQQTDIMPTILGLTGYNQPYMAFGVDLFHTPASDTWAMNYLDGIYQFASNGHVLQFDGEKAIGLYRLEDYRMEHDLKGSCPELQQQMERQTKAIIQQYMTRMIENRLKP